MPKLKYLIIDKQKLVMMVVVNVDSKFWPIASWEKIRDFFSMKFYFYSQKTWREDYLPHHKFGNLGG